MTTATPTRSPRTPVIDRDTAKRLMTVEYERVVEQLRSLAPDEWSVETCNTGWDIRALAAHMTGMVAMAASVPEQMKQMRAAKKRGGEFIDALTAVQVEKYAGWSPEQLIAEYARLAPKAVKGRMRTPGLMRNRAMPDEQPINPPYEYEAWTFGYLLDVILTRDPWLHRIDIVRATGAQHVLTAEHDGVIVADVVAEWAARHGRPYRLRLNGPAGGEWSSGSGGPELDMSVADFCLAISGRAPAEGLLTTQVPF
jgi:uncharacterized protein (TIGR03083 family)